MITLEVAQNKLQMWLDAEDKVSQNQEYKSGSFSYRRADLPEIRKQIDYWDKKVKQLSSGRKSKRRVTNVVPMDN